MKYKGSKFFHYRQNNSGGSFIKRNGLDVLVVIEAMDYLHANAIAEDKGIYFHGCSSGRDCSCCGDRWYEQYDNSDGYTKVFEDKTLKQKETAMKNNTDDYPNHFVIYYLDGRVVSSRGRIINAKADYW
jgi:hypothetical protein